MANSEKDKKIGSGFKRFNDKLLHSDGLLFTFARSSMSSQVCGWLDALVSFICFSLFGMTAWLSTATGAFIGGIANCIVNYNFTFHAYGVDWRVALTKFIFVWAGSLLLNSFGTQWVYHMVNGWEWVHEIHWVSKDGVFIVARLLISLIVSLAWNFLLQRYFVFKVTRIDAYIKNVLVKLKLDKQ